MKPCLVLDLDDTLVLERDYVRSGFRAVGAWVKDRFGLSSFEHFAWNEFAQGRRSEVFDRVMREAGIACERKVIEEMVKVYRDHKPNLTLQKDAAVFLDRVRVHATLALISDGPVSSQRRKMDALRLWPRFELVVFTDIWGRTFWKPHTRAFEVVQAHYGHTRYMYIGDNPHKDFDAPRKLGWSTTRIRRPGGIYFAAASAANSGPDCELPDLDSEHIDKWITAVT